MAYLQGDLQTVFDALYSMGVIDPILAKDWVEFLDSIDEYGEFFAQAVTEINSRPLNVEDVIKKLSKYDDRTLELLAMEVAREYAEFHSRGPRLH